MHRLIVTILGVCLFCWASAEEENKCPTADIKPCTCKTYFDGACIITCSLSSQEHIEKIADIPNPCGGNVHFVLVHSKIDGIPARLWKTLLSSKTVDVSIKHSSIKGLVPPGGDSIPEVYTNGAAVIKIDHSKVEQWDWKQLSKFHSKEELTLVVDDTPLEELTPDFSTISGGLVHKVTVDSAGLKIVQETQFANFPDLVSISFQNNLLTAVSRKMAPRPAKKLQFIHLNGNLLTSLPEDAFADYPALEVIYLRDNKMKTLPQNLFKNAPSSLQRVDFYNNPWECNCDLLSVLQSTKTFVYMGNCASPDSLAKKKIRDLANLLEC